MTLHSGVGEGALAAHYTSRWFKDGFQLENANVSRGKDFSLHIEPVELSNAGEYVSSVTIDDIGHVYIVEENERPIILTVFSEFSCYKNTLHNMELQPYNSLLCLL